MFQSPPGIFSGILTECCEGQKPQWIEEDCQEGFFKVSLGSLAHNSVNEQVG